MLIIGATSGIGRAAALQFAAEGAKVAFCGRRENLGREVEQLVRSQKGVIEVIDEGPGIADVHLERVFDRFYRVPGEHGAGSGLGLSICQAAAARLGGQLTLVNRTGAPGLMARVVLDGDVPRSSPL